MKRFLACSLVALGACSHDPTVRDQAKQAFNAGDRGPRLIVFLSSGCAACETGSAALEAMLETYDDPVTVLAVWEPVEPGDGPPTARMLGHLVDPRVHQLWDPDHVMSDEMRAIPGSISQARLRTGSNSAGVLYDTVALFKSGSRWDRTLPSPTYLDGGLAAMLPELARRL